MQRVHMKPEEVTRMNRWIPITERMPKKRGFYIVSMHSPDDSRYIDDSYFSPEQGFLKKYVEAWMYGFKPYNPEEPEEPEYTDCANCPVLDLECYEQCRRDAKGDAK